MAVLNFISVMPAGNGTTTNNVYQNTLGASANSGTITTGNDSIVRIVASGAITVRFGTAANLTGQNAGATDMYIPANTPTILDIGHYNDSFSIFSIGASTIITVTQIAKN